MRKIVQKVPSRKEEIGNSISHLAGAGFAIVGLVFLILKSVQSRDPIKIFSFLIYGISLILLYTSSTLYHAVSAKTNTGTLRRVFKTFDHVSIFLLIAGTYTPFALVTISGKLGWTIFIIIWAIAIGGIIFKSIFINRFPVLSTTIYIVMGWLIVFVIKPLALNIARGGLILIGLGGIFYTSGVVFYAFQRMKYNHLIWHFFVLAGSIAHYFAILIYV